MTQTAYEASYKDLIEAEKAFMTAFKRLGERATIQINNNLKNETGVLFTGEHDLEELLQRHAKKGRLLNGLGSTLANGDSIASTFMPFYDEVKDLIAASAEGVQLFAPLKSDAAKDTQFIGGILKKLATVKYSGSYADKPLKQTVDSLEKNAKNLFENVVNGDLQQTKERIDGTLSALYSHSGKDSIKASLDSILNVSTEDKAYALLNILSDAIRTGFMSPPKEVPANYVESQAHLLRFNPDFGFIVMGNLENAGLIKALEKKFPPSHSQAAVNQGAAITSQEIAVDSERETAIHRLNAVQQLLTDTGIETVPIIKQAIQDIKAQLESSSARPLNHEIAFANGLYEKALSAYESGSPSSLGQALDDYVQSNELKNVIPTLIAREYENKGLSAVPNIRMTVKTLNDSPISLLKYTGLSSYLPKQMVNLFTFNTNQANAINAPLTRASEKAKGRAGGIKNVLLNNGAARTVGEHIGTLYPKETASQADTFSEQIIDVCNGDKKRAFNTLAGLSLEASRTGLITTKMEDVYRVLIAVYDGGISDASAESGIQTLDKLYRVDSELKTAAFYCHEMQKEREVAEERGYEIHPDYDLCKRL